MAAERNPRRRALVRAAPAARRRRSCAGHGYSSSKHNLDFLCGFLASHGFGVYNLDFPGHKLGASGGELRGVDDCIDAMSASSRLRATRGDACVYTLGHSMGGMTAIFTAALDPAIAGTIAIATGYGRPTSLAALRAARRNRLSLVVRRRRHACRSWSRASTSGTTSLLPQLAGRPALYVAADRDAMVSPRSVRELYERAPEPKTFATVDSDHTYAGERARATVLQWLNELHPRNAPMSLAGRQSCAAIAATC